MISSSKQVYTYTAVRYILFHKVQKSYGYEVLISFRDIEEYCMEYERPTKIMSLNTDPNTRDTDQIGLNMLYQAEIV